MIAETCRHFDVYRAVGGPIRCSGCFQVVWDDGKIYEAGDVYPLKKDQPRLFDLTNSVDYEFLWKHFEEIHGVGALKAEIAAAAEIIDSLPVDPHDMDVHFWCKGSKYCTEGDDDDSDDA
jgi:hypothetical protein